MSELDQLDTDRRDDPPATAVSLRPFHRLSAVQRQLWSSQLRHPDSPHQNMATLTHLDGAIDPTRLADAFGRVVEQSDVLRTRISVDDTLGVEISPAPLGGSEIIEIARADVDSWALARARTPLDMRVCGHDSAICVHEDGTASWYLGLHHVITDATSSALVFEATAAAYHGDDPAFDSFYAWANTVEHFAQPGTAGRSEPVDQYWLDRIEAPRVGHFYRPIDRSRTGSTRMRLPFSPALANAIDQRLATDYRMLTSTLGWTTLLVTAAALHHHRVSGARRFAVGLPVHNRSDPATRQLIGPTIGVFPVDIAIELDDTHRSLHKRAARAVLTTLRHASTGESPSADYDIVVNVIPHTSPTRFGEIPAAMQWLDTGAIDPDDVMRVHLTGYVPGEPAGDSAGDPADDPADDPAGDPTGDPTAPGSVHRDAGLMIDLGNSAADARHRERAPEHVIAALTALVEFPDAAIGADTLCSEAELSALAAWEQDADVDGDGDAEDDAELIVPQLRRALAGRHDVVIDGDGPSLTGDELWRWIVATAHSLRTSGAGRGARVAVALPPSIEAVVAVFAALVAGASFVPLDPRHPHARRRALEQRAGWVRLFDSADSVARFRPDAPDDDVETGHVVGEPDAELRAVEPTDTDEAYLLFTSGSTGEPKGVPVSHRGLARYIQFALASYFPNHNHAGDRPADGDRAGSGPVAPLFGSLTFDLTITSLFAPLLAGGRLVTIPDSGPAALAAIADDRSINWCKATPSHLEILARLLPDDHSLRTLVVGGEAFSSHLARRLLDWRGDLAIYNEYGPTEAVVGCMIHRLDSALLDEMHEVPIGRPAPGVTLRVVDEHLQRVPIGAAGELLIASPGLTVGYLGGRADGAEHAESGAHPDPFVELDGTRFYRSGDLVELRTDDCLVYLGRIDEQIKVGGVRLEPIEVEAALERHPLVKRSAVRLWSPTHREPGRLCTRCGLPDNVPGVSFDATGVCSTCHAHDRIAPVVAGWFGTPDELVDKLTTRGAGGDYDCMHLLSGGKDSTYALHRLVDMGLRPYVLTLDNGFVSPGARANIVATVEALGLDHEFATTDAMNQIFQDSLATHSNVCNGCYKTLYTLATNRASKLGIGAIVTGLSRGQLFETRLIPQQFSAERFDADAVDRAVLQARKLYHRVADVPNRLLDTTIFEDDAVFDEIDYVDFYRYVDVELSEMLDYLQTRTAWKRPVDTGRSTNCLINVAGIQTHLIEQGYHNYAVPYAWDVRLGHKDRQEAIDELNDDIDPAETAELLATVGYTPSTRHVLTAWIELTDGAGRQPSPSEFRSFLGDLVPPHAIPSGFVVVAELPMTTNGKLDEGSLPAPARTHRSGNALPVSPTSELEAMIVERWEQVLQLEPIGIEDDFFALGGDSLDALRMIVGLGDDLAVYVREELAFVHTTPQDLAHAIEAIRRGDSASDRTRAGDAPRPLPAPSDADGPPPLSPGEQSILFGQGSRPDDLMYNVARLFEVAGDVDAARFEHALRAVAAIHQPLSWSYGSTRRRLTTAEAVAFEARTDRASGRDVAARVERLQRTPFDLERGPLLRCLVQPRPNGTTLVAFAVHHVSGDHESFDRLWAQIDDVMQGRPAPTLTVDYAGFCSWQADDESHREYWIDHASTGEPNVLLCHPISPPHADGFVTRRTAIAPEELRGGSKSTPVAVAVGSVAAAVRPYVDHDDVELALVASTRTHPAAEQLFGYLLNPVPLRVRCAHHTPLSVLIDNTALLIGSTLPHRSHPLAKIRADRRARGLPEPSTNILVAFDDAPPTSLDGAAVTQSVAFNGSAVTDLSFFVEIRDDGVDLSVEYSGAVLDERGAADLLERLDRIMTSALRAPETAVDRIELATPARGVLSGPPLAEHPLVIERIVEHIERRAELPAVVCGDGVLTWGDLGERARGVAAELGDIGIGPGDRVIVAMPRTVDLVAAIVGVHLAGAAYVPVDPAYPAERIALLEAAAEATARIAPSADRTDDRADGTRPDVTPIGAPPVSRAAEPVRPDVSVSAGDIAYVIFTSGSTGTPRGVAVSHGQLAASTAARADVYSEPATSFAMLSSVAFDSSIVGLFWTLADGGEVVLPTDAQAHDVDALIALFDVTRPAYTLCVPTLYRAMLDRRRNRPSGSWPGHVIVAGEACPPSLVAAHFDAVPDTELTNEYGPTETTVWSTVHRCRPGDVDVPIGPPIPGTWVAIVDEHNRVRPVGVHGGLIIGGAGVTAGYVNDAAATLARFGPPDDGALPGSDLPPGRYFRTGDTAVIVDGAVRFLGRHDEQLNLGGARIEPAEIEQRIVGVGGVTDAVVTVVDTRDLDGLLHGLADDVVATAMREAATSPTPADELLRLLRTHGTADLRLVAHVEAAGDVDLAAVRSMVSASLPALLRPTVYGVVDRLPRLPNGKIDRRAAQRLAPPTPPAPKAAVDSVTSAVTSSAASAVSSTRAADEAIAQLTALFRRVLRNESFQPTDSFFDHGGYSLLVVELIIAIEQELSVALPTTAIYEAPTPVGLAQRLPGIPAVDASADTVAHTTADTTAVGAPGGRRSSVIPIQTAGDLPPIFATFNLGNNAEYFRPLSARLGDRQPFYGLGPTYQVVENKTRVHDESTFGTVDEIAATYAAEIDRLHPDGPVTVMGICGGAVVGYSVVQQLAARGRDVDVFVMINDWHAPGLRAAVEQKNWRDELAVRRAYLSEFGLGYIAQTLARPMLGIKRRAEIAGVKAARRLGLPLGRQLRTREHVERGIASLFGYDYTPYHGRVLALRGEHPRFPAIDAPDQGWTGWLDDLAVVRVPGRGFATVREPNVAEVAEAFLAARRRSSE